MRSVALLPFVAAALIASPSWASTLRGNVEGVYWQNTGWHVEGWTCRVSTNQSLDVVFYIDAPWPQGIPWSGAAANKGSEPAVGTACATTLGAHRFSYRIPYASLKQYAGRTVVSYAQLSGETLGIIPTAGVTLPAQPFKSQILGQNEGVSIRPNGTSELIGWACAHGLSAPTQVHIYAGQPWPNGVMIGSVFANQSAEPSVGATCGTGAAHRFGFALTAQMQAAHAGKPLYAHAMFDTVGANELIAGQGTMPAPISPDAPSISPGSDVTIQDGQSISIMISTPTSGATVRYTTGAVSPDCVSSGEIYAGPISVSTPTTIRAISCLNGLASSVASSSINVFLRPPSLGTIAAKATAPIMVSLAEPSGAATIRYSLSAPPNCASSSVYGGPFVLDGGTPVTVRAISCRQRYTDSAIAQSPPIEFQADAPVIQVSAAGPTSTSITMSSSTPGASIRYSSGSAPLTCSSGEVYGGTFVVAKGSRLEALTCRAGYLPSTVTRYGTQWAGPEARVVSTPGGRRIQVGGKVLSPIYLAFNGAACAPALNAADECNEENVRFVEQVIRAYDAKALRSQTDVLIEYNIPRFQGALNRLSSLVARIKAVRPEANLYFMLRFEIFPLQPSAPDDSLLEAELLWNGRGDAWDASIGRPYRRMNAAWVDDRSAKVMEFIRDAQKTANLEGTVVGAFFTYLEAGEFFTEARHPVPEEQRPGARPWIPEYKNDFFYFATSPEVLRQRLNPTAGAFVDGPFAAHAVQEAEQQAIEVADAIAGIARNVKAESDNRLLVKVFYGYNTGLGVRRAAGRHHALGRLLASPDVDMIAAPYSYAESVRGMGTPMVPQTSIDSITLAGKLAVVEDDTRTHIALGASFGYAQTSEDSSVLLARNSLTSILRGANVHLLDLQAKGWFLDVSPNVTFSMARTLANVGAVANSANLSASPGYRAQTAVFIDEASVSSIPIQGLGATLAYPFAEESGNRLLSRLSGLGAPVRNYLLSHYAAIPDDELFALRLLVLPDAYRRSAELRGLIARVEKLHSERGSNVKPTFLFLYAPGVLANSNSAPPVYTLGYTPHGTASEVPLLKFRLRAAGSRLGAFSCAHDLAALSFPAVYALDDTHQLAGGWTAGFCDALGERAYGVREMARFRVAFSADPAIPELELARLMDVSGVHRFLSAGVVEAQGDTLMVYRTGSSFENVSPTAELPTILEYPDIFKTHDPSHMTLWTRAKRADDYCLGGSCQYFPKVTVYRMTRP